MQVETDKPYRQVYLEICNFCNLACDFCPRQSRPAACMDPALFRGLVAQAAPLATRAALHVLGEPLLHPHFPELIRACGQAGLPAAITTNGTLLHIPEPAGALLDQAVCQVNISLQAAMADAAAWPGRRTAILEFLTRALGRRPDLYLNLRLWNQPRLGVNAIPDDLHALLEELAGRARAELPAPVPAGGRKSRRLWGRLYLHFDTRFIWPGTGNQDGRRHENGFCHALGSHFAVLADGTVVPCCLDHAGQMPLGDGTARSLAEILGGGRAQAMRAGFAAGRLVEDCCRRCSYCRRFSPAGSTCRSRPRRAAECRRNRLPGDR